MPTDNHPRAAAALLGAALLLAGAACHEPSVPAPSSGTEDAAVPSRDLTSDPAIVMAIPPFLEPTEVRRGFGVLAEALGAHLARRVEVLVPADYPALLIALEDGTAGLTMLSPYLFLLAKDRMGDRLTVVARRHRRGKATYHGVIFTRRDAGITTLDELAGKRFVFTDRLSSSGYIYPWLLLRSHGIDPDTKFGTTAFLGDHQSVIKAVRADEADAGAAGDEVVELMGGDDLLILARTDAILQDGICVTSAVAPATQQAIKAFFLGLEDPEVLEAIRSSSFEEASEADYADLGTKLLGSR